MYNSEILEVFLNSQFAGNLKGATVSSTLKSKEHGDVVKLYLKINDLQVVEDAKFKTFGGVPITYAAAKVCEFVTGQTLIHAQKLNEKKMLEYIAGLPQESHYVADLCLKTLNDAIKKYFNKQKDEDLED